MQIFSHCVFEGVRSNIEKWSESQGSKSKAMALNREERLECEVRVDGMQLEHASEFKYLRCVFDEAECRRKVVWGGEGSKCY